MSKKLLFKLVALVACLLCSLGSAAAEAYANINFATASMTFYYDDLRSTRTGKTYDLNGAMYTPDWYRDGYYTYVQKVSFDSSFAVVYPRATNFWFAGMTLRYINGLEYLNTSAVTNMECMFCYCGNLTSIDLGDNFDTSDVTTMRSMFSGCTKLTSINLLDFDVKKGEYISCVSVKNSYKTKIFSYSDFSLFVCILFKNNCKRTFFYRIKI